MHRVVFIYNELLEESYQEQLKLPLEFVCFAYIEDYVLYDVKEKCIALPKGALKNTKGSNKVYGALYILQKSEHFLRVLDATQLCSKGAIGRNHQLDGFHRQYVNAIPIHFKGVENFLKLKYNEGEPIRVISYIGNPENEYIKSNVLNSVRNKVQYGFDINNFINLVVKKEKSDERIYSEK